MCEYAKDTKRHHAQVPPQLAVVQAKIAHMKDRFREFEAALLNAWDTITDSCLFAANMRGFLGTHLQKGVRDFFTRVLEHFRAGKFVFCTSMSEH